MSNGNTNIFFGGSNDPLLGSVPSIDSRMQELEQAMRYLEQQKQNLVQMQGTVPQTQQRQSATPIWDELDSLTAQMTEKEFAVMAASEEFQEST